MPTSIDNEILSIAPLIPLLPLLAAVVVGTVGLRVLRAGSHWPVIFGVGGALVCSLVLFVRVAGLEPDAYANTYAFYSWISTTANVTIDINFRVDPLTAIMLVTVCSVSLLVVIYSRDYMREHGRPEHGYERFFAFLALFVFSMCTLVLAGNFLLLYLGWEAVGLCSYLLIGFYYQRASAAQAARKAFIVTRVGDFGFGLGVLLIYRWISPFAQPDQSPLDYTVVFDNVRHLTSGQCTAIALLLFSGAVGKSAQLPLHVWLPDAMEGPSPVSALIHAATMVTAGVYMVVRCGAIFVESPVAMGIMAWIGAITALFAATIALAQYDMKRILAYSTISQLGYMFLGAGVFAADSAIFHLFTHAFFKSLLFLAAGSVMHAMGGIIDMRRFGGLRRILPVTFATFLMGSLALAGFPFFSGFFSKDEIIHAAFNQHPVLGSIGLFTAVLTAVYTFRMVFVAFCGQERLPEGMHPHESGRWMLVPMILLAIGAVFAGYAGVTIHAGGFAGFLGTHGPFQAFLAPVVAPFREAAANLHAASYPSGGETAASEAGHAMMYASGALAIAGVLFAHIFYLRRRDWAEAVRREVPEVCTLLNNKYFVDELYDFVIVRPLWQVGRTFYAVDQWVIDGILWFIASVPQMIGSIFRVLQSGALQGYGVAMAGGVVLIVLIVWSLR